jgi:hypothetical protein
MYTTHRTTISSGEESLRGSSDGRVHGSAIRREVFGGLSPPFAAEGFAFARVLHVLISVARKAIFARAMPRVFPSQANALIQAKAALHPSEACGFARAFATLAIDAIPREDGAKGGCRRGRFVWDNALAVETRYGKSAITR